MSAKGIDIPILLEAKIRPFKCLNITRIKLKINLIKR
jgi:hypothetical protein